MASSSGPISEMVVRIGWPSLPNRSQNTTGKASKAYSSVKPIFSARLARKSLGSPAMARPATSPFTSAQNTGTPACEKPFRQDLQRHRLAGAGGAGDQAVAIGEGKRDIFRLGARADEHLAFFHHRHAPPR